MKRKELRKLIIVVSLVTVLAIVVPFLGGCFGKPAAAPPEAPPPAAAPPEEEAPPKTVAIGFIAALSGPEAGWGLPGLTGVKMWIEDVNARGGLLVGGERYLIELYVYDDEAIASKALMGARQLVLENDVKFVNSIGGAPTDACAPFFEERGVIYAPLMQDTLPTRPLCVVAEANSKGDPLRARYLKEAYPEIETVAIASQDDPVGRITNAFEIGAWEAMGVEVVYESYFGFETVDFAPIVTAMMNYEPDVLSWGCSYPTYDTAMYEQAYLQGFEGYICSNYIDVEATAAKVPAEWLEARESSDGYPEMEDPWWGDPSPQKDWVERWNARFGPGAPEDVGYALCSIDWDYVISAEPWGYAAEKAGTFEGHAVVAAMKNPANWPLPTILGDATMWGTPQFGIDNQILPPIFIDHMVSVEGVAKRRIAAEYNDWPEFFDAHPEIQQAALDRGMFWSQRVEE